MQTFTRLLASFVAPRLDVPGELSAAMEDVIESSTRGVPARDKLVRRALEIVTPKIVSRAAKGPEFLAWLDEVFEQVARKARRRSLEQWLDVDRVYLDDEEPFVVSGRFLGDSQEPDTEVPARLSHGDLAKVLTQMGGKPSVHWEIREVPTALGRELHVVYSFRVTFPMKELVPELLGRPAINAAADAALTKAVAGNLEPVVSRTSAKRTARQLDAEIAAILSRGRP